MRSMVAGSTELSRSLFVPRSTDVIGIERNWCGAWWRGALSSRGVCLCHGVLGPYSPNFSQESSYEQKVTKFVRKFVSAIHQTFLRSS